MQSGMIPESLHGHTPSSGWTRQCSASCFYSHTVDECPFHGLIYVMFFRFLCFVSDFTA